MTPSTRGRRRSRQDFADADAKRAEARKERDEFQRKNQDFDQQRATHWGQVTEEAAVERQRLLDATGQAADALTVKRQEALISDAGHLDQSIRRRAQEEVFAIARKTLTDLASTSLEERMAEVFSHRLRNLNGQSKTGLGGALKASSNPALVRSAFDLAGAQRATIQNALNETFSADIHLRFETAPDLVSGIELTTDGQKVAWSIADYLGSLEKGVGELLKAKDKPAPPPGSKPEEAKPGITGS